MQRMAIGYGASIGFGPVIGIAMGGFRWSRGVEALNALAITGTPASARKIRTVVMKEAASIGPAAPVFDP